ncbi:MAG: hypothetical protein R3C56_15955 [Pirellulaceae bacterium]
MKNLTATLWPISIGGTCPIHDESLRKLVDCQRLRKLTAYQTQITDVGLQYLYVHKDMGMMQETLVTEAIPAKTPQPALDFVGHHEYFGQWHNWVRAYGPRRNAKPSRALEHSITGLLQSILSARAR